MFPRSRASGEKSDLVSAGVLLYRFEDRALQVFLAHPGGPFFEHKDTGVWSIPKGLCEIGEDLLETARREFQEETGFAIDGAFMELGSLRLPSGKLVHAWALEKDIDAGRIVSNSFKMEWPRHSGQIREYPEMDRAAWFSLAEAKVKIVQAQRGFIDRLVSGLGGSG